jgi:hypothetical protein
MEFSSYKQAPKDVQEEVVAAYRKELAEQR